MSANVKVVLRAAKRRLGEWPAIRTPAMWALAVGRRPQKTTGWLITVMYHDLPATARSGFARQLRYMRSLGDFVTAAQAVDLLVGGRPIGGRFFSVTFDDGERNAFENGYPVLAALEVPSAFFIVPEWVSSAELANDPTRKYVTWEECRQMARGGVTIGSHSLSHRRFASLNAAEARSEIFQSKYRLEAELGRPCEHFACPWGQPDEDYLSARDPDLATEAGYRSFFTTIRGRATAGASPWAIPRVRLEPGWGLSQLRYVFTR